MIGWLGGHQSFVRSTGAANGLINVVPCHWLPADWFPWGVRPTSATRPAIATTNISRQGQSYYSRYKNMGLDLPADCGWSNRGGCLISGSPISTVVHQRLTSASCLRSILVNNCDGNTFAQCSRQVMEQIGIIQTDTSSQNKTHVHSNISHSRKLLALQWVALSMLVPKNGTSPFAWPKPEGPSRYLKVGPT